jgi:hypothetical protein
MSFTSVAGLMGILSCVRTPVSSSGMSFMPVAGLMGILVLSCVSAPKFGNGNSSTSDVKIWHIQPWFVFQSFYCESDVRIRLYEVPRDASFPVYFNIDSIFGYRDLGMSVFFRTYYWEIVKPMELNVGKWNLQKPWKKFTHKKVKLSLNLIM